MHGGPKIIEPARVGSGIVGILIAVCLMAVSFLLSSQIAMAGTINVPADQPTIQAGIDAAVDGDTVLVAPGTYVENITYLKKNIVLLGSEGALQTILRPIDRKYYTVIMDAQYAELRGFSVVGGAGLKAVIVYSSVNDLLADNIFREFLGTDVVIGCRSNALITRNLFYNNGGISCIGIGNNATASIIGNTFYNNARGFHSAGGKGTAKNNIVINSTDYGIWGEFDELDYNCVWNNNPNYENCPDTGIHSISANPGLLAPEILDFSLTQSSPCIDAGDPDPQYNNPDGSRSDIGAVPFIKECPRVFHINLGDEKDDHVLNHSPNIYWSYYDSVAAQVAFEIEIGTDSDWTSAETWSTGQTTSTDTSAKYEGVELQDGETYFVRVHISNGIKWGDWSQLAFRMNAEPTPPMPQWPADGESVRAFVFEMSVISSYDAEDDNLVYEYEIYDDPGMSRLARYRDGIPGQLDSTLLKPLYNLETAREYWWRVRAFDGFENSEWSPLSVFTLVGGAVLRVPGEWPTIQSAVDASAAGDMVLVAPGTYSENISCISKNVRIAGEKGALFTILRPADPAQPTLSFHLSSLPQLSGFTVCGTIGPQTICVFDRSRAIISDCRFTGNDGQSDSSAIISVLGNAIIERNQFYANSGITCIRIRGPVGWETEILNNTFDRNPTGIISEVGRGIVKNNIFTHFSQYATAGRFPEYSHNCFWNNTRHRLVDDSLTNDPGPGNMVADPRFMYRLDGDYRLLPESPCIDAGDPDRQYHDPDGSRNDIGALPFDLDYPLPFEFNFGPSIAGDILPTPTPEFFWSFLDIQAGNQQQYELEVGTDNDWREAEMWATGPVLSADTHVVYDGQPLQDHHAYVLRIRVHNGEKWGSWVTRSFVVQGEGTASDWSTDMGNVRRTGCNPNDKIQPPLERQWAIQVADGPLWPVTVVGDKLFIAKHGRGRYMWCLDANDGYLLWQVDYGQTDHISQASYGYGMVFTQVSWQPSFVSALDIETGAEIWRTNYPNQASDGLAPAVYDGQVSICGDFYGGVHTFDAFSGEILWKRKLGDLINGCWDRWAPAQYDGKLYISVADVFTSRFYALDQSSGNVLWSYVHQKKSQYGYDSTYLRMKTMAVIDTSQEIVFFPDVLHLRAFDINTHEQLWQAGGAEVYYSTPAIHDGNVYVIRSGVLDVRDIKTGDSLWSFTCEEGFFSPIISPVNGTDYCPVIANGYVFLSSCSTTYAVDLNTHQAVWSTPVTGFPVVSHEKLYISSPNGILHMFSAAPTDVESDDELAAPHQFALNQNYPNPFNASTRIDYYLPKAGHVQLVIHNILGQTVRVLVDEFQPAGEKTVYWDGRDRDGALVATGIYLYNLQAGNFLNTKKMLLLK